MAQALDTFRVVIAVRHIRTRRQYTFVYETTCILETIEIFQTWEAQDEDYELDYFYLRSVAQAN
jgi:hypothetical protein